MARPEAFVVGHFQDSVDGFLLGGVDEAAGVDDEDVGLVGMGGELMAAGGCSWPIMTSLSTRFLGQPRLINPTVGRWPAERGAEALSAAMAEVSDESMVGAKGTPSSVTV